MKSYLEKIPFAPSARMAIIALLPALFSAGCVTATSNAASDAKPTPVAAEEAEDPAGGIFCEMLERMGAAEGPGLQPKRHNNKRTYVLCKRLPGVIELSRKEMEAMAEEALSALCDRTRRCVEGVDINDTEGFGMSHEDYHCVGVTAPQVPEQDV